MISVLLLAGGAGAAYLLSPWLHELESRNYIGEVDPLGRLAMRLSSKYRRELGRNPFSLMYTAEQPRTIVLVVRYQPELSQAYLRRILDAAEENARVVAHAEFHLDISTRIDMEALPPEPKPEQTE
jgi:hypothetical protein